MIQALKRAKKEVFIKIIIILILFGPFLGITLPLILLSFLDPDPLCEDGGPCTSLMFSSHQVS